MSERSSTTSRRWSGCSASTLPIHPNSLPVVSTPAPAITARKMSISSLVSRRSRAGDVLELGVEQFGDRGRPRGSSPATPRTRRTGCRRSSGPSGPATARRACSVGCVGLRAYRRLVGVGDADQHADRPHRQFRAEVEHEVEPVGAHHWIQAHGAEGPNLPSIAFILFGVKALDTRARWMVCSGGSSLMNTPAA